MDIYGTTTGTCDCYQLTDELPSQAGSIWSPNSIELTNSFDFTFDINLGDNDASGADGLVFVIRQLPGDPGGFGGGLGYEGIDNSIGVEVDTWFNAENGDIPDDHIGMHSNGLISHDLIAPIALPNVEDGMNHSFRVTWDPATLELEVFFDGPSIFVYTGDLTASFFDGDPTVYFGWTAGTGGSVNRQIVCSYREVEFTTDHTNDMGVTLACSGELITFFDSSTSDLIYDSEDIIEWEWDFGDGESSTDESPTHSYDDVGTYTVTLRVKDITGCFSETTITVQIGGIALDVISNEPTCFGYSDGSVTINAPDGLEDPTFTITDVDGNVLNEDNSNTANELPTGWYYLMVEDESGCSSALDSIFIGQPDEMDMEITTFDPLCNGFETGWARVDEVFNYTGDEEDISFFWNPNPSGNEGVGADSTWSLGAGEYTLTINDENGCSKTFDFTISEPEAMEWAEFGTHPAQCRLYGYQNGNGVVYGAATGGTGDFDYHWENDDDPTDFVDDITTWGGKNPGNYTLTATDDNGCILILNVVLDSVNPIADFTVNSAQLNTDCQGTATAEVEFVNNSQYFADPFDPTADTTFFWNLDNPTAGWQISNSYFETFDTTYGPKGQTYFVDVCLVAINKNGCKDTLCKELTIYEPIAFTDVNVFSPNGDGKNDVFTFEFRAASISEFQCVIVNRWGVVVDELTSITDGWDGTDRNGKRWTLFLYL